MISGIAWVSELVEVAGGIDVFADRSSSKLAKDRVVTAAEVIHHAPDIIVGSWCGKKFRQEKVAQRPGFDCIPAVQRGARHEIKSSLILLRSCSPRRKPSFCRPYSAERAHDTLPHYRRGDAWHNNRTL